MVNYREVLKWIVKIYIITVSISIISKLSKNISLSLFVEKYAKLYQFPPQTPINPINVSTQRFLLHNEL